MMWYALLASAFFFEASSSTATAPSLAFAQPGFATRQHFAADHVGFARPTHSRIFVRPRRRRLSPEPLSPVKHRQFCPLSSINAGDGGYRDGQDVSCARGALSACFTWLSSGVSALAAQGVDVTDPHATSMGPRLDTSAALSFGAVFAAFVFLQARIRAAIRARTSRREYEAVVKGVQNERLSGLASEEDVKAVEQRMLQLIQEEEEATKLDILGVPFNLVIPDGGPRGGAAGARRAPDGSEQNLSGGDLGIREAIEEKAQSDMRDNLARQEEMGTASTLKVAALWLVLISQLWLLFVLWNDPMGPAGSSFLKE